MSGRQIVAGIIVLMVGIYFLGQSKTAAPPVASAPAGYTAWFGDSNLAFQWIDTKAADCSSIANGCWRMYVIPHRGCANSLYVELSITDSSGTVLGYTNDVAGAVAPDQKAKLEFTSYKSGASRAQITKMSCY